MSDRPRIDRRTIGRAVKVSEHTDHVRASFRHMTPNTMLAIIFAVLIFQGLIWLCFINDFLVSYGASSQSGRVTSGWLAERYLGPVYDAFSLVRDIYARLLADWWGWAPNEWLIVFIAAFGSALTWSVITKIVDRSDILPRVLSRLPFPPFTYGRTIRFYPDYIKNGSQQLPFSGDDASFRLDVPDRIRDGRGGSRVLYGQQVIVYNNGGARYPIITHAFARSAADIQNSLGLVFAWWKRHRTAFVDQKDQPQAQATSSDRFLSPD